MRQYAHMNDPDLATYSVQDAAEAAQHLSRRNLGEAIALSSVLLAYSGEQGDALGEALERLASEVGAPTLLGGDSRGPNIRWQDEARCLVLDSYQGSFRLTSQVASALEQRERAIFENGVGDAKGQVAAYADLPFLWQVLRRSGAHQPMPRCLASDWERLEESLRTLTLALATQLPAQIDGGAVAFDIVNHSDHDRPLTFLWSPDDGPTVMVNDEDAPLGDTGHAQMMTARGWQSHVAPLARWWMSSFEPDTSGASAAARLAVAELQARGAHHPSELGVAKAACTNASGVKFGDLLLPGLGLRD